MLRVLREWVLARSAPASPLARACALHLLCRDDGVAGLGVRLVLLLAAVGERVLCEVCSLQAYFTTTNPFSAFASKLNAFLMNGAGAGIQA